MTNFCVAGFLYEEETGRVALVRKTKPDWQAGRLNGIGGKFEKHDKTMMNCMIREWEEETVTRSPDWIEFAQVWGIDGWCVIFYKAYCDKFPKFPKYNDAGEQIECYTIDEVLRPWAEPIDNLHWLLPLAFRDKGSPHAVVKETE